MTWRRWVPWGLCVLALASVAGCLVLEVQLSELAAAPGGSLQPAHASVWAKPS